MPADSDDLAAVVDAVGLLERPTATRWQEGVEDEEGARAPQPSAWGRAPCASRVGGADNLPAVVDLFAVLTRFIAAALPVEGAVVGPEALPPKGMLIGALRGTRTAGAGGDP